MTEPFSYVFNNFGDDSSGQRSYDQSQIEAQIADIVRRSGFSPRDQVVSESYSGINITGKNQPIPLNREDQGYTFFTRPSLNLSYDNISLNRVMSYMASTNKFSLQRYVRCLLDNRLLVGASGANTGDNRTLECPAVDPLNPFIPILTNNMISMSGWPDFTVNTRTMDPGVYREGYSYVDDVPFNYETFDLQVSFRNLQGDPITFLLLMWGWYQGLVYDGTLMPYPDAVVRNYLDYTTRIWRIVTDPTRRYVTRIGACGAAFPVAAGIGNIFNIAGDGSETPYPTANDQISTNFRCMGFTYYDYILIYEFNTLVAMANSSMHDDNRESQMVKLKTQEQYDFFNFRAYPRINPITMEMEWWIFDPNAGNQSTSQ